MIGNREAFCEPLVDIRYYICIFESYARHVPFVVTLGGVIIPGQQSIIDCLSATLAPQECTFEQSLNRSLHSKLIVKAKSSKRAAARHR